MEGYADSLPRREADWPAVVAVVPARNEADGIERALRSLLGQDYPGALAVLLVDDQSEDSTADIARDLADRHPQAERLGVLRCGTMPEGWVGKMWAVHTGVAAAAERFPRAKYLLLTDADVEHERGSLRRLVCKAENEGFDLVSIIDDCALGKALKRRGRIWVGLGSMEYSFRPYRGLSDIWDMVAGSAYTQLHHSPLHGGYLASTLALAAWLVMAWTYLPTLRDYGLSPLYAFLLPISGLLYLLMTLDSARRHRAGHGAHWKGRAGAGNAATGSLGTGTLGSTAQPSLAGPTKGAGGNNG